MVEEMDILDNTVMYSTIKYISYFVTIITGLVVVKYLGPAEFGVYSLVMLMLNYSRYSFMGFFASNFKKSSYHRGKNEEDKLEDIRQNTFAPSFWLSLSLAVLILFVSLFLDISKPILRSIQLGSLLIIIQQVYYFISIYLRIDKKFIMVGLIDLGVAVLRLVLILVLILVLSTVSVIYILLVTIIAYITLLLFAIMICNYRFEFRFSLSKAIDLLKFGLPNTFLGTTSTMFISVDKLMIIQFLNTAMLGMYSFAYMVIEVITYIPHQLSIVLLPSMIERAGAKTSLKNIITLPLIIVSYMIPLIIGGAVFFSEPVISLFFPQYSQSISPLLVLVYGSFFLANIVLLENIFVAKNNEKQIVTPKLLLVGVGVLLNFVVIRSGLGLLGIAVATVSIYTMYFFYLASLVYSNFDDSFQEIALLVVPFIYMVFVVVVLNSIEIHSSSVIYELAVLVLKYILFVVMFTPLFIYLDIKTNFFTFVIESFTHKFKTFKYKLGY